MEIFVKVLTKTDIEEKLAVLQSPSSLVKTDFVDFMTRNHLVHGVDLAATDFTRTYQFRLSTRGNGLRFQLSTRGNGDYTRPVFQSREWLQYVRDNGLQVVDTIDFWKDDNGGYGIRATRNYF